MDGIDLCCVGGVEGYFWAYDAVSGRCEVPVDMSDAKTMSWTVWSWTTEMIIFLVVPVAALIFNVLVIVEVRRISNTSPTSTPTAPRRKSSSKPLNSRYSVLYSPIFTKGGNSKVGLNE